MRRAHYSASFATFLNHSEAHVLGELAAYTSSELALLQRGAWIEQIRILRTVLAPLEEGHILFEYAIPRLGKRIDNVLIYQGIVYLLEFKVGETSFHSYQRDQVLDYALDLKYFHAGSTGQLLAPILVCTHAELRREQPIAAYDDGVIVPRLANVQTLSAEIARLGRWATTQGRTPANLDPVAWEQAHYAPTPTIIEAAQALYANHGVEAIARTDASAVNLSETTHAITTVIHESRRLGRKSICFITGVPGAGKTLAGLNIANQTHSFEREEHAVFLSGNGPLVNVLREALARDEAERSQGKLPKRIALQRTSAFIQNIHHFRDEGLRSAAAPIERVVIWDEAQRAWTREKTTSFMREKKGVADFGKSEPEFLIEVMDRHAGWAVIVCLIGSGQEIHTGEAGLPEWFRALRNRFPHWHIYVSNRISDGESLHGNTLADIVDGLQVQYVQDLHLSTSLRSFRSEQVADFVKALLDVDIPRAQMLLPRVLTTFPIALTRELQKARAWIRSHTRGNERTGIIVSSGAHRLRPHGLWVSNSLEPTTWFLNGRDDVRSSSALEMVATEFDIQGLELDWTLVGWDADLRFVEGRWQYHSFKGSEWQRVHQAERVRYLLNAYRVLLTRARQGMILFLPGGDGEDRTHLPDFYDGTFAYLRSLGIPEV